LSVNVSTQLTGLAPEWNKPSPLKIYPNPAQHTVHIDSPTDADFTLRVYALDGRSMHTQTYNPSYPTLSLLDVSTYPPGIYIVQLNSTKATYWAKLIKTH